MKEKREILGMSQEDLAKRVSVSRQTINYIENGTKTPDITKAFEIARALQAEVSEIFIHVPIVQDVLVEWDKGKLQVLLAEMGIDKQVIREDGRLDLDVLETLTLDNAVKFATRLEIAPEIIFEFNFEEKKQLERKNETRP
jgi:putative transcriptional regulator